MDGPLRQQCLRQLLAHLHRERRSDYLYCAEHDSESGDRDRDRDLCHR